MGGTFGERLKELDLKENELSMIAHGMMDGAVEGKKAKVDMVAYKPKVHEFFRKRRGAKADQEKKRGAEYMEKFLKEQGVQKTESGLLTRL